MPLHPLELSITPGAWPAFRVRRKNKKFLALSKQILERDYETCQFCGFQASDYQEVVNLDRDYRRNTRENMITACCFCAQCHFIDGIGGEQFGGGNLIYLPEMTQPEINSLCHVLFCAIANKTGYRESAQNLYRSFKFRAQHVEESYGKGASDPGVLVRMMMETNMDAPDKQVAILKDLRLLPSRAKFKEQIEHWARTANG